METSTLILSSTAFKTTSTRCFSRARWGRSRSTSFKMYSNSKLANSSHTCVCVDESKLLPYWKKDEDGTSGTKLKFQFYVQNPNGSQQCFDMPAARIWFLEEIAKDDPIELSSDKTVAHGMHIDDCINRKYLRFKLIGPNIGENGCGGRGMCRHKENGGVECWRPGVFCWDTELRDCDDAWHRVHDDASLAPNFRTALEEFAKEWGKFKANNFKTKRGIKVSVALQY